MAHMEDSQRLLSAVQVVLIDIDEQNQDLMSPLMNCDMCEMFWQVLLLCLIIGLDPKPSDHGLIWLHLECYIVGRLTQEFNQIVHFEVKAWNLVQIYFEWRWLTIYGICMVLQLKT